MIILNIKIESSIKNSKFYIKIDAEQWKNKIKALNKETLKKKTKN